MFPTDVDVSTPASRPHQNQYLFSDHYLNHLLPEDPRWAEMLPAAQTFQAWLTKLYAAEGAHLAQYNEAQLEQHWIRPILECLGHVYEPQASVPGLEAPIKRPDYVLFPTEDARQEAAHLQRSDAYAQRALAIAEAKAWDVPLGKKREGSAFDDRNPSWQIDYYVRTTGLAWGLMTNGRLWRLVHRDTSMRLSIYYQVDLVALLQADDPGLLRYLILFFSQAALLPDQHGHVFLQDALDASQRYALALEEDLQDNAYDALEQLIQGFLDLSANGLTMEDLPAIYDHSLLLLYRLLFILYAESRGLLPMHNDAYRRGYSLQALIKRIRSGLVPTATHSITLWSELQTLFQVINGDDPRLNRELNVPRYNGGLFSPQQHPFLVRCAVGDGPLVRALNLLTLRDTERGPESVDYRTLGVRHLGSIYEGLLEFKPRHAEEPMVVVDGQWRPEGQAPPNARVVDRRETGRVYLVTDKGERKATGSYYTPAYIVQYIVEHTLGPLVEEARERIKQRALAAPTTAARRTAEQSLADEILSLKVLDPAMGSGHFLVEATEFLALALAGDPYLSSNGTSEEDLLHWKRRVVERCIYGVDLNPLAVELAKLSLWLATVAAEQPLSFLDHHLACGDSLIGARVDDLGQPPAPVVPRKRLKETEQHYANNLFSYQLSQRLPTVLSRVMEIIGRDSDDYEAVQAKEAADRAVRALKAPFWTVADLWTSAHFGNTYPPAAYEEARDLLHQPEALHELPAVQRAQEIARERRFLHWELAFPEVFYDENGQPLRERAGFDAVIGNPPYLNAWAMTEQAPETRDAIRQLLKKRDLLEGHWDLFIGFVAQALDLVKPRGYQSFIVPNPLLGEKYAERLRWEMLTRHQLQSILSFGEHNVFDEVSRQCIIYVLRVCHTVPDGTISLRSADLDPAFAWEEIGCTPPSVWLETPNRQIRPDHASSLASRVMARIENRCDTLGQHFYVNVGATLSSAQQGLFGKPDLVSSEPRGNAKRFFAGADLNRWHITWPHLWLDYRGKELSGARAPEMFEADKLVIRKRTDPDDVLVAAYDETSLYCDDTVLVCCYYDALVGSSARTEFKDHERTPEPVSLLAGLSMLNSRFVSWLFGQSHATTALQGSYSDVWPKTVRALPIRRIAFTTLQNQRARLAQQARSLYADGDHPALLAFAQEQLAAEPERSDVVHDLLAHLAEGMTTMHRQRQEIEGRFWVDLEGVTDANRFRKLRDKGKQEATLARSAACRPYVDAESRSTRRLHESLAWDEGAFKAFIRALVGVIPHLSKLVDVYRQHAPAYTALLERIRVTDVLIDQIVYRLYGLTEDEIALVEASV